jgi:hypothetical protein
MILISMRSLRYRITRWSSEKTILGKSSRSLSLNRPKKKVLSPSKADFKKVLYDGNVGSEIHSEDSRDMNEEQKEIKRIKSLRNVI